jgi:hypothetical protein
LPGGMAAFTSFGMGSDANLFRAGAALPRGSGLRETRAGALGAVWACPG